ncbi:MAG: porin, partial [Acidobacteriota bacterium]|nr:porin [Acidobacteriota bacterium]
PERIVVTNARLIGRDAPAQDVPINLLIVDGKLAVVTKDDLVIQPGDVAVDASGGFLFGQLVLGSSPSFVVLDQDPRENVDVLLDTKTHARFAIREGVIVRNELPAIPVSSAEDTPRKRYWKAYTPPPIAVPIRYFDSRKWNKFETKPISGLFIGALLLDRQFWLSQDGASEDQVGDLSDFEGGEIRVLRAGVVGTLNFKRPWRYTVFAGSNTFDKGFDVDTTDEFAVFDYRLDIPLPADLMLSVGKQKEPISMERLMGLAYWPMQERSAVADALLPARNHGVVLSGTGGEWFTWAGGAFNNWIDSGESFGDTSSQLVGRVTWVPAVSDDESNLLHLGLGLRYSDAKQPVRARTEPEFNNAPLYVDTGPLSADDAMTYNLEAYWRKGPWWVGFEYIGSNVASPELGDPTFNGYHLTGSWAVTGETRAYRKRSGVFDPLPVSRPVNQGGWGALELALRYSRLDLTDGAVDGGEMDILSLGAIWWLSRSTHFALNYRHVTLDRESIQGNSSGINARILLMLD